MTAAFAGVRVIDFTQGIAGPMATMFLADFGAEVIKVEGPGGDRARDLPGYLTWNRNKQRLVLDLARYEGLRTARDLLATADAAVFDWHPGEMERRGLDAVTLHRTNPGLLHAWLPPYAEAGRWAHLPPEDSLLMAVTGAAFLQLSYEDVPVHLVTPQATYAQAMDGAVALAAGLYEREHSGLGQAVVVSGLHATASIQSGSVVRAGEVVRMASASSRGAVPNYRLYRCADGLWFFLGTLTAPFFIRALEAIDLIDVLAMEGVEGEFTNLLRPANMGAVIARLDARFAEKPRAEWLQILAAHDVPCGPVGDREEWFASETVAANAMRLEFDHPRHGRVVMPGLPVKLSETPGEVRGFMVPAPAGGPVAHEPRPGRGCPLPAGGPLAGVRVLDLGAFIAGTFAPTILAHLGADIVKVETLDGDPFRITGLIFAGHNRGKRGLAIDLKREGGREAFLDLVRGADLVLDNYRAGVRERLGIGYETLAAINPRIISCSVTGYGPVGPLAAQPGFDPLMQARSGLMAAQGGDDEPVFYQIAVTDTATALMAAFGMVAALNARERTGRGQEVVTSLANQAILCQAGELTWYEGRPANAIGAKDCVGVSALHRYYRCSGDEWLGVAATQQAHFQQLAAALGHPEWAGRFTAEQALCEPRDSALAGLIAATLETMSRDEAVDRVLAAGVPAAPALRLADLFDDPWIAQNNWLESYEHPLHGPILGVRAYSDWSRTAAGFPRRAPLVGEHTREVLAEFGFAPARIDALIAAGAVRQLEA